MTNPAFIEQDCTFKAQNGHSYQAGGAVATDEVLIGYLEKTPCGYKVTTWHGDTISEEVTVLNEVPLYNSAYSNSLLYVRVRYNGRIYSGSSLGARMLLKARVTKLKSLHAI